MNTVLDRLTKITLRLADASDAEAIASVLLRAFVEYQPLYTPKGFAATTPSADEVLSRMREGPIWVAVIASAVVATASAVIKQDSLYIRGMAVLPDVRDLRMGEMLLTRIEAFAFAQGCKRLFLSTTPFLQRAIKLYERHGFQRISDPPHVYLARPCLRWRRDSNKRANRKLHEVHTRGPFESRTSRIDRRCPISNFGGLAN